MLVFWLVLFALAVILALAAGCVYLERIAKALERIDARGGNLGR